MNVDQIDNVLRLLDREIWIVTAAAGGRRGGLAATWVSPASIDRERPMLLAGIAPGHFTAELIDASGTFVAHLLRPDQTALAWNFACDSGRNRDKLAGLSLLDRQDGPPVLADCLAWLQGRVVQRYDSGDRLLYWADVVDSGLRESGPPLREQAFIGSLTGEQRKQLAVDRDADIAVQRPRHQRWRDQTANLQAARPSFREP
jgi:flavin reductase (DIM6/NTAB) family NADH-FMN oxidoreductase RutF